MEHDTDSQSIFETLKDAGAGDGWNVVKILLDIRAIDKDEITAGISAAQSAQKAKRTAIICCTIAVIAMLITGVVFAALASGIQIEHTVTTDCRAAARF
jgi:hypothetical protein